MNKEELKQYIDDNIYENQDGEITGESLNAVLKAIVDDGGTEVEANPTSAATETLEKIKIGKTVYTAPQGEQGEQGEQGKSAYQIAVDNGYEGTEEQWLASLKATIGAFKFIYPTDTIAEAQLTTIGSTYASPISGVSPTPSTLSVILLMNDTNDTKTMMIATQDDGDGGFEFVYVGDLKSAMPSNVATLDDLAEVTDEYTEIGRVSVDLSSYYLTSGGYYSKTSFPNFFAGSTNGSYMEDSGHTRFVEIPEGYTYVIIEYTAKASNTSSRFFGFTDENDNPVILLKEGDYAPTSSTTTFPVHIMQRITSNAKRFYFSCNTGGTMPTLTLITYQYNANSVEAIKKSIGDVGTIGSDNVCQAIFNGKIQNDYYKLSKFEIRNLVGKKYKRFDLGKEFGDVTLDADDFIEKLPIQDLLYDGNKFLIVPKAEPTYDVIIYASPNGGGDGYTEDNPTTLANALTMCNGKILQLEPGIYKTNRIKLADISTKICCVHGKAVIVLTRDSISFSDDVSEGIIKTAYDHDIKNVLEMVGDEYVLLEKKDTKAECDDAPLSYYIDGDNQYLYVNCASKNGDNILVAQSSDARNDALLTLDPVTITSNQHVEIENVDFVGGFSNVHVVSCVDLIMKNCQMICTSYYIDEDDNNEFVGSNSLWIQSTYKDSNNVYQDGRCTSLLVNCTAKYATFDGYNYHRDCAFVELNCVSGYHGEPNVSQNSQASTSHENCVGLRINGVYFDSRTACVADVNNAFTVNVNCVAFQTSNIADSGKSGFAIAWDDNKPNVGDARRPVMYLFGCRTFDCIDGAHVGPSTNYNTDNPAVIYSTFCDIQGSGSDNSVPLGTEFPMLT